MTALEQSTSASRPGESRAFVVVVALPTYLRPLELSQSLPAVEEQAAEVTENISTPFVVNVVVIDNDPKESARPFVLGFESDNVRYVAEPRVGLSAVRNRAIDEAVEADILVFIDDDEVPATGWLNALTRMWLDARPAAVVGPVQPTISTELSQWVAAGDFYRRRRLMSGTTTGIAATNNLLLDLGVVRTWGLRFDERLGLSGGEDSLFTRQLVRAGGTIMWCNEALVYDRVPLSRTARSWLLSHAWSHGNNASIVERALARNAAARWRVSCISILQGLARIVVGATRIIWGIASGNLRHQAQGWRTLYRGGGRIAGAIGHQYLQYDRKEPTH